MGAADEGLRLGLDGGLGLLLADSFLGPDGPEAQADEVDRGSCGGNRVVWLLDRAKPAGLAFSCEERYVRLYRIDSDLHCFGFCGWIYIGFPLLLPGLPFASYGSALLIRVFYVR